MKLIALENLTGLLNLDSTINADSEEDLNKNIEDAARQGINRLVFNFLPLDHMNSAGASVLVKLAVAAKKHKIKLLAYGLSNRYQEIFRLTDLNEGITLIDETSDEIGWLSDVELHKLKDTATGNGKQDDRGWVQNMSRLQVTEKPDEAMNKNVDGRRVIGPLQGFGPMWQKTYLLNLNKPGLQPTDVITTMKQHFPEFQPIQNHFFPTSNGITAGEIVLIDSSTPGGIVSTGVLVLYADELSFTLMTPQGHPEAGWVTFSARNREEGIEMQIQGLARAADPFYEFAFRIAGSKFQETIWKHVLSSLAAYLDLEADVKMVKKCVGTDFQWSKTGNIWYNAQIRSLPYNVTRLFDKRRNSSQ